MYPAKTVYVQNAKISYTTDVKLIMGTDDILRKHGNRFIMRREFLFFIFFNVRYDTCTPCTAATSIKYSLGTGFRVRV